LCVHGARHSWSRLKWLADVNALLAASDADIGRLYQHAARIGAGLCAGQALLLCRKLLALPLPAGVERRIAADTRAVKLAQIALVALTAPRAAIEIDGGVAGVTRSVYTQFLLGRSWRFYATQCAIEAVGTLDVVRWPLPSALRFLYPLIRLPMWLWRRASRGWRAR